MIAVDIIIKILFIHWVADFVLQTTYMAMNKSKDNLALLYHVMVYTIVTMFGWFILVIPHGSTQDFLLIFAATFIIHFITDYLTSRWTSKLYANKKYYGRFPDLGFFAVIGLDQLLHYTQLFYMYKIFS